MTAGLGNGKPTPCIFQPEAVILSMIAAFRQAF